MLNAKSEKMLTDLFKTCLIVERYVDKQQIFNLFVRIYRISDAEARELERIFNDPTIADLKTEHDCKLYYRCLAMMHQRGQANPLSELLQQAIAVKANAIKQLAAENLCAGPALTVTQLWHNLYVAAEDGIVDALRTGGLLLCENLLTHNNFNGYKWLYAAASWLDYTSLLYLQDHEVPKGFVPQFNYDETLQGASVHLGLSKQGDRRHGRRAVAHNVYLLLDAVKTDKVQLDRISPEYHKVIYSHNLSEGDKEKLIMRNEYDEEQMSLLPTDIGYETDGPRVLAQMQGFRPDEREHIRELIVDQKQSTVCLACSDPDALYQFEDMIVEAHSGDEHLEVVDVADLHPIDFEGTVNNVFLHSCVNGRFNTLVLRMCGNIPDEVVQCVKEFLEEKSHYKLIDPNVTLDMSDMLVYCLCDERNAQAVDYPVCVQLRPLGREEKLQFIRDAERRLCRNARRDSALLTDDMVDALSGYPLEATDKVVAALLRVRGDGEALRAAFDEQLADCDESPVENKFGFGGYKQ